MDFSQETKKIIVSIPQPPIKALVFKGGGIKGIAYVGALRSLKEQNLLESLEWVAGSSAGAMVALLVALGYTQEEIEYELKTVNFEEFKDYEGSDSWWGKITGTFKNLKKLVWDKEGYYLGKKLHQWLHTLIKNKLKTEDASFDDLHKEKIKQSQSSFKDLLVTVTNFDKKIIETLGYKQKSTGKMPMADAVLASMSIPGVFRTRYIDPEAQKMIWEPMPEQKKNKTLIRYVDGGVLSNYSMEIFSHADYWPIGYYGLAKYKSINPSVLGLRVDSMDTEEEAISSFWASPTQNSAASPSVTEYIIELFNNLLSDNTKARYYGMQTIFIPIDKTIGATDFHLDEKTKSDLINSGEQASNKYINNYLKDAVYDLIVYKDHAAFNNDIIIKQHLADNLDKLNNATRSDTEYRDALKLYFQSATQIKESQHRTKNSER